MRYFMKKNNGKTLDIMLDLETLGTNNSPVILQLSAVPFDIENDKLYPEDAFNELINPQSCAKIGLNTRGENSNGTALDFWLKQDPEVFQKVVLDAFLHGKPVIDVLTAFTKWCESMKKKYDCDNLKIYGNGPAADCVWVRSAYEGAKLKAPTMYWDDNCVRTFVDIGRRVLKTNPKDTTKRIGAHHNAIWDCNNQILWVLDIVAKMKGQDKSQCHEVLAEYAKRELK